MSVLNNQLVLNGPLSRGIENIKNFRKKFLAFSVLSLSGVLLMAGVTGCNS